MCGETFDRFGDHALTCMCCGDRTIRHNCLRNVVCEEAAEASLRPEEEKQGLSPERPSVDGIRTAPGERRPADIWLPRGTGNKSAALDFAVTSGLRSDWWQQAADHPNHVFEQYEEYKRSYKDRPALQQ